MSFIDYCEILRQPQRTFRFQLIDSNLYHKLYFKKIYLSQQVNIARKSISCFNDCF
jgi:hypothetical protein